MVRVLRWELAGIRAILKGLGIYGFGDCQVVIEGRSYPKYVEGANIYGCIDLPANVAAA